MAWRLTVTADDYSKVAYLTKDDDNEIVDLVLGERGKPPTCKDGEIVVSLAGQIQEAWRRYPDDGQPLVLEYDEGGHRFVKAKS